MGPVNSRAESALTFRYGPDAVSYRKSSLIDKRRSLVHLSRFPCTALKRREQNSLRLVWTPKRREWEMLAPFVDSRLQ